MRQCKCQFYTSISTQPSSILCPFLAKLGGQGDVGGWKDWLVSSSKPKPKNIKK